MSRIRSIKPEFFDDPDVAHLSPWARLAFIGLWTEADREGRLVDAPTRLKARLFSSDLDKQHAAIDMDTLMNELEQAKLIIRYTFADQYFISIRSFLKHQHPHPKEPKSIIPAPCEPCREMPRQAVEKQGEPGGFLSLVSGTSVVPEPRKAAASEREGQPEPLEAYWQTWRTLLRKYADQTPPLTPSTLEQGHLLTLVTRYPDLNWLALITELYIRSDDPKYRKTTTSLGMLAYCAGEVEATLRRDGRKPAAERAS